ncbi:chemerin-like receptor 1 [Sardina pilchardus]|uniref:chemerin-like receptor 1 n=1 Tax=Sardina pilchardus TaxID=27697 RepID=UPI002E0D4046
MGRDSGINGTLISMVHDEPNDYEYNPDLEPPARLSCDALCVFVLISNIIIFILGIVGNGLVIWIIVVKTKRTVNSSWYLSLAVSDFLFCTTVPFNGVYMATGHWHFGHFMCKFISVAFPLNMYCSIFLLLVISVDRCMCVIFPVWTQNHRTLRKSSAIIALVWIVSALLTLPSIFFSTTQTKEDETTCIHDHDPTAFSRKSAALICVVFGLAVPLMVIVICYSVIMLKLRANPMMRSSKPFKVMTAVIITFVICWLPFQIFQLLEVYHALYSGTLLKTGIQVTITIAYANSFMNPILYSFMGQDFRNKCLMSVLTRMENALQEEGRCSKAMSMSKSADG